MAEQRTETRRRSFLRGVISYQKGTLSEDCVIRNFTSAGAMIEQPFPHAPESFDLVVPERAERHAARVVWRNGLKIGVRLSPCSKPALAPRVATFEGG